MVGLVGIGLHCTYLTGSIIWYTPLNILIIALISTEWRESIGYTLNNIDRY